MKKLFEAFQQLIKQLKSIKDDLKVEMSQLSDNVVAKIENLQQQVNAMQHLTEDLDKFKSEIRQDIDTWKSDIDKKIQNLKVGLYEQKLGKKQNIANVGENLENEYHTSPEVIPKKESEDLTTKQPEESPK